MKNYLFNFLIILSITNLSYIISMELDTPDKINIADINPFKDGQLNRFPAYCFDYNENKLHESSINLFRNRYNKREGFTKTKIEKLKNSNLQKKYYGWIYTLFDQENVYLKINNELPIDAQEIEIINKKLRRFLARESDSKYRTLKPHWKKTDLDPRATCVINSVEDWDTSLKNAYPQIFLTYDEETGDIHKQKLDGFFNQIRKTIPADKISPLVNTEKINDEIVDQWISDYPGTKKNTINYLKLREASAYVFPDAADIPELLCEFPPAEIHDPEIHPIEKAARMWFEIIRINPFISHNQNTAIVICATILAQNGYLPPEIENKNVGEYKETLIQSLRNNDIQPFVQCIAKYISRTQEKYKDSLDV